MLSHGRYSALTEVPWLSNRSTVLTSPLSIEVTLFGRMREDIKTILHHDPAARSVWEVLTYPGLHAILLHRWASSIWRWRIPPRGFWKLFARIFSQFSRFITGIEIHPGATI